MTRLYSPQKWAACALAAAITILCAVHAAAAQTLPVPEPLSARPKTEADILAAEDFSRYTQGNHQYNTGYYYETVEFELEGERQVRQVYYYLSSSIQIRDYFTVIALPEGVNTQDEVTAWLDQQGWFDKADEMGEGLVILPAGVQGWGAPEQACAYLNAVLCSSSYSNNSAYFSTYGCHYFVGYEGGAAGMQLWAAENPLFVISQVYVDSSAPLSSQLEERGALTYGTRDSNGNVEDFAAGNQNLLTNDSDGIDESAYYPNVERREVPIPTWMIGNADEGAVSYWKQVNDCMSTAKQDSIYGDVFLQDKNTSNAIATASTGAVSQVAVQRQGSQANAQNIYRFLSAYTRYDNTSVYGNFLGARLDWAQAIQDGRLTICTDYAYKDPTTGITWTREYMIYKPANSQAKYPQGAPVVVVHSGGTQPCSLFFDCSNWWQIADEYGFILAFPHSTGILTTRWNEHIQGSETQPYDFGYTSELIDIAVRSFGADPGQVFITGQSMGCFYTNYCGSVLADKITAIGGTSGLIITDMEAVSTNGVAGQTATDAELLTSGIIPAHLIIGEYDNFCFKLGPIGELDESGKYDQDGYYIGHNPSETYYAYPTLTYWVERNNVGPFEDYQIVNPNDLTPNNTSSLLSLINPGPENGDRYTTYAWTNSQGIPLFEYTQCYGRHHNFAVSDCRLLWETWFSRWSRDMNTGCRYYEGQEVQLFSDLNSDDWYYPYICSLFQAGKLTGDAEKTIRPNQPAVWNDVFEILPDLKSFAGSVVQTGMVTRQEIAEVLASALSLSTSDSRPYADNQSSAAAALFDQKIMTGFYNEAGELVFGGDRALTRAELFTIAQNMQA